MSSVIYKYPHFEVLEIEQELSIQFKKYRALTPIKKGDHAPELTFAGSFNHWQQFFNGAEVFNHIPVKQLASQPLVVAFYSPHWKEQGLDLLKKLNAIQADIRASGSNLIIVTEARTPELEKAAWDNNLTLTFYIDPTHQIARNLGIYHQDSPVWERFSGVDAHVPLIAGFVITTYRQVTFGYTNWHSEQSLNTRQLLEEAYLAGQYLPAKRSA